MVIDLGARTIGSSCPPWEGTDKLPQRMLIHVKLSSLFIVLMLATAMFGCEAATQPAPERMPGAAATPTDSTGTPAPASIPGIAPETWTTALPKKSESSYHNLDTYLNKLVARFEKGLESGKPTAEGDSVYDSPVLVKVHSSDNVNAITTWLENNAIPSNHKNNDECLLSPLSFCLSSRPDGGVYVMTVIPVDLLVSLSQQPDVSFVSAMEPYPKLSDSLRDLAVEFDEGPRYYSARTTPIASLHHTASYVVICSSYIPDTAVRLANLQAITIWIEDNGIYYYHVEESKSRRRWPEHRDASSDGFLYYDYIFAEVPVYLLGDLSKQEGIRRVGLSGCSGPDDVGKACGPPQCNEPPPFAAIRGLGQSEAFILFTNVASPPGIRVSVNREGDTGMLGIGSCPGDSGNGVSLGHAESITITGCSAGNAHVRLYKGDNLLGEYKIAVMDISPEPARLSPEPLPMKVGQSLTFTLNTRIPNPPGMMVTVNKDDWHPGNLAIGDCPGAKRESAAIAGGDTITVTACAPGTADLHLIYQGKIPDNGPLSGYTSNSLQLYLISVWGK